MERLIFGGYTDMRIFSLMVLINGRFPYKGTYRKKLSRGQKCLAVFESLFGSLKRL